MKRSRCGKQPDRPTRIIVAYYITQNRLAVNEIEGLSLQIYTLTSKALVAQLSPLWTI